MERLSDGCDAADAVLDVGGGRAKDEGRREATSWTMSRNEELEWMQVPPSRNLVDGPEAPPIPPPARPDAAPDAFTGGVSVPEAALWSCCALRRAIVRASVQGNGNRHQ